MAQQDGREYGMDGDRMQDVLSLYFSEHGIPSPPGDIVQVSEVLFVRGEVHGYFLHMYDIGQMWCGNIIEDMSFTCIHSFGGFTDKIDLYAKMLERIVDDVVPNPNNKFTPIRPKLGEHVSSFIDEPLPGELMEAGVPVAGYHSIGVPGELATEEVAGGKSPE